MSVRMLHLFLLLIVCSFKLFMTIEIIPERGEVKYFNPKYVKNLTLFIRKQSRHSPYTVNLEIETLCGFGNNLSIDMVLLEQLSGRYQPTFVRGTYKLCDYLYNEPYLGQMYAKQLPANWKCPFPAGAYHFNNMVIKVENFNFTLPFTWASVAVQTRADFEGYFYVKRARELAFIWQTFTTIMQKPKKSSKKHLHGN